MIKDTSDFYKKEMERLERNQKDLHDQYNQENQGFDETEYVRKLRQGTNLKYSWATGETLQQYMMRLQIHVDLSAEKNIRVHVHNNGRGCWFQHKDKWGNGCFMCEDINLIHYLCSIINHFSTKYPMERNPLL